MPKSDKCQGCHGVLGDGYNYCDKCLDAFKAQRAAEKAREQTFQSAGTYVTLPTENPKSTSTIPITA